MRILFILDSVENPTSANVLMAQRLAGVLCVAGHTVHLLELWDGLHPQPELPGCTVHCLAFADERLMNAALENGELPLEDSVRLYKEGLTLSRSCREQLEKARNEVRLLTEEGLEPFDEKKLDEEGE